MYHVREARGEEVFKLVEISRKVLLESPTYKHLAFDPAKSANYLMGAILKQPGWFLRIIARNDSSEPVGGMCCTCHESIFGPDKIAYDITVMVEAEHRGRCVRQLMQIVREYKDWAVKDGAKLIKVGVSSSMNMDKASAFFEHLGFARIGAMHGLIVGG